MLLQKQFLIVNNSIITYMLSKDEIEKNIVELDSGWELKDGKVVKSFQFSSFINAIGFVNEVAKIAERLDHHPIITINWKTVKLSLKSFDVDAITRRDIALAKEIEKSISKR
jgi:4a-hydroxytetrahydrobiopterin dehydratase